MIRASTAPVVVHSKESFEVSIRLNTTNENHDQQTQYLDDTKFDYITRWLTEVRAATCSKEALLAETKSTKRRFVP